MLSVSAGGMLSVFVSDTVSVLGGSGVVTEEAAGGKRCVGSRSIVMGGFRVPG